MSGKKTAQAKSTKKANSDNKTDVDYKSKHKEIEAELVKARKETNSVKNALLICQYDLSVLRNNFNYEEVRKLLPMTPDVDGLQAGETARLTIELKQLQQELDKLKGSQHGNSAATQSPKVPPDADTNKLQTLQTENEKMKKQQQKYEDNTKRVIELEENKKGLNQEIIDLKTQVKNLEENKRISSRTQQPEQRPPLSQMAGAQLMINIPNIAELSDQNRPTKLAEQYTELYDNEWTNVYEILELSGKSERAIIETLYGILKDTYAFCIEVSKEQTKHLKLAVTTILHKGEPISDEKISVTKLRQLRDLRKTFAPDMIDSVFEYYKRKKSPKDIDKSEMKTFVHKCITLCWLMNVHDPPVVVDTKQHAGAFNSDIFKSYTKTGKEMAFIVWPPLYLHADGPMLSKGIAQGK